MTNQREKLPLSSSSPLFRALRSRLTSLRALRDSYNLTQLRAFFNFFLRRRPPPSRRAPDLIKSHNTHSAKLRFIFQIEIHNYFLEKMDNN